MTVTEKYLEKKLIEQVRKKGGKAWKWVSPGITGVPDRIVTMPTGRVTFVELKSPGGRQSPRQKVVASELGKLGHPVWVVDSMESLNEFLEQL